VRRFLAPVLAAATVGALVGILPAGANSHAQPIFRSTHTKVHTVKGTTKSLKSLGTVDVSKVAAAQTAKPLAKPSKAARMYQRFLNHRTVRQAKDSALTPTPKSFFKLSASNGPNMIWDTRGVITKESATANGFDVEPPDQGICANGTYAMEGVNLAFQVYPASGGPGMYKVPVAMNTFFGLDSSWFTSDPRCFYDPLTKLWYATALGISGDLSQFITLLSVSQTSNPTGVWNAYSFDVTNDGNVDDDCPCLGDQPLLGTDANGIYITTNSYSFFNSCDTQCFNGAQVYAISKSTLLHAGGVSLTYYNTYCATECFPGIGGNFQPFSLQPTLSQSGKGAATMNGTEWMLGTTDWCAAPSYCPGDTQNAILVGGLTGTNGLNSTPPSSGILYLLYTPGPRTYEFPQLAVPQKAGPIPLGSTIEGEVEQGLLSNDDRMNQTYFANDGTVWGAANSEINSPGVDEHVGVIYWHVSATFDAEGNLSASFLNYGFIAHVTQDVWFPAIVVPPSGNPTVALDLSGPNNYPSPAYVQFTPGPQASGTIYNYEPGKVPEDGFTCYPELFGYGPPCRWGDYTGAQVMADGSVWLGTEYIPAASTRDFYADWGTRVAHVADS
jgi:hypothetical protein